MLRRFNRPLLHLRQNFSVQFQLRHVSFTITDLHSTVFHVTAKKGENIMKVCLDNDIEMEAACEGECCCSTCHCFLSDALFDQLEEPEEEELDMLDLAIGVQETSRLACQVEVDDRFEGTNIQMAQEVLSAISDAAVGR